jgi:hypothetical protein
MHIGWSEECIFRARLPCQKTSTLNSKISLHVRLATKPQETIKKCWTFLSCRWSANIILMLIVIVIIICRPLKCGWSRGLRPRVLADLNMSPFVEGARCALLGQKANWSLLMVRWSVDTQRKYTVAVACKHKTQCAECPNYCGIPFQLEHVAWLIRY